MKEFIGRYVKSGRDEKGRFTQGHVIDSVMMDETRAVRIAEEAPELIVFVAPLLHDWIRDEDGDMKEWDSDVHGGPECSRCDVFFCRWCEPEKMTEPCKNQTHYLF